MDDVLAFARLLDALRPWHGYLVIVGGWAHRLHRFHPLAHPPSYLPLQTRAADLAIAPGAPLSGGIAAALKAAGFNEECSGFEQPPVAQYHLGDGDTGFGAEFLVPLRGVELRRDGSPDATSVVAGVVAQKLRHVDLLLARPWVMGLGVELGVPLAPSAEVQVANPVAFIAQKLLIQRYRPLPKRSQDVLYIHDTLDLFGPELDSLRSLWTDDMRPVLPEATARQVEKLARKQFSTVTDTIRRASRIPQDRAISPERLQEACSYGLTELFGSG